jgi:hypothetical protein
MATRDRTTTIMQGMQGVVLPIIDYQTINWTSLASATEDIVLADRIPVAPFTKIGLSVRIHKLRLTTGVTMQFIVLGINPSVRDGQDFVDSTALGSTATFNASTSVPSLIKLSTIISDVQHPMIRVVLQTIAPAGGGINVAILGADLVMRTGG